MTEYFSWGTRCGSLVRIQPLIYWLYIYSSRWLYEVEAFGITTWNSAVFCRDYWWRLVLSVVQEINKFSTEHSRITCYLWKSYAKTNKKTHTSDMQDWTYMYMNICTCCITFPWPTILGVNWRIPDTFQQVVSHGIAPIR